jgi:hypothetical protein
MKIFVFQRSPSEHLKIDVAGLSVAKAEGCSVFGVFDIDKVISVCAEAFHVLEDPLYWFVRFNTRDMTRRLPLVVGIHQCLHLYPWSVSLRQGRRHPSSLKSRLVDLFNLRGLRVRAFSLDGSQIPSTLGDQAAHSGLV